MKYFTLITLFYVHPLLAETQIWKMGDRFFEMSRDQNTGVVMTSTCEKKKCAASLFLKTVSFKNLTPELFSGGKNPGAVLCHESKMAEIIFLKDLNGNDNSFCLFKDKSMVSASSIEMMAQQNDGRKNAK